jgi:hypothetical protein
MLSFAHVYHASHHVFTTKNTTAKAVFSEKTPAKTPIHHAGKMWGEETNL